MAWEGRGSSLYYYRKRRQGKHVSSEYVGSGLLARLLSDLDQTEREKRNLALANWESQKQEVKSIESDLVRFHEMTSCLIRATLLISGYHPHKGQWRKKRNVK